MLISCKEKSLKEKFYWPLGMFNGEYKSFLWDKLYYLLISLFLSIHKCDIFCFQYGAGLIFCVDIIVLICNSIANTRGLAPHC